ncbi:hypothetical protein L6164_012239 [Bauhinia variegata]|uniref:Uncharacterized protein n=1 Tax=Bauhinia variegata TaxID=167791 RepID=A0ACB9P8G2_BAUVA|nr:hypothetical protein L6164_012239 [Bauhinia variegata]
MGDGNVKLPPGFQFCPTDEELILHFLSSRANHFSSDPNIIPDLDLSRLHPWELNEPVLSAAHSNKKVGIKKNLIFNIGEPPFATETGWIMQEYHLCYPSSSDESQWILCRVYERNRDSDDAMWYNSDDDGSGTEVSWLDEVFLSLDDDHDLQEITDY